MTVKKVLVISDSFKGSLSSRQVADIAFESFQPFEELDIDTSLFADGGEGSLDCVASIIDGQFINAKVTGIWGNQVEASYFIAGDVAYIESALVCEIASIDNYQKNPFLAASDGVGHIIVDAVKRGCKAINLFLGGTATIDGGAGMMRALGCRFYDDCGNEINSGNPLVGFSTISFDNFIFPEEVKLTVVSDVVNSALGYEGGVKVYGPQKGLKNSDIPLFENGIARWIESLNKQVLSSRSIAGYQQFTGAAGGLVIPLLKFENVEVSLGFDWFRRFLNIDLLIRNSDVVITGEGRIDVQTSMGKGVGLLAHLCRNYNKPVYAVCGSYSGDASLFDAVLPLVNEGVTLQYAIDNSKYLLKERFTAIAALIADEKI